MSSAGQFATSKYVETPGGFLLKKAAGSLLEQPNSTGNPGFLARCGIPLRSTRRLLEMRPLCSRKNGSLYAILLGTPRQPAVTLLGVAAPDQIKPFSLIAFRT
jgi:hypothetical protein